MNICSECDRKVKARGLCATHYHAWWVKNLKPKDQRRPYRVKFAPALWAKWWAKREPTAHAEHLRMGIQLLRNSLK